VEELQVNAR